MNIGSAPESMALCPKGGKRKKDLMRIGVGGKCKKGGGTVPHLFAKYAAMEKMAFEVRYHFS